MISDLRQAALEAAIEADLYATYCMEHAKAGAAKENPATCPECAERRVRRVIRAYLAATPAAPHNVVACINCKQSVTVTAVNGVKCDDCRSAIGLSAFVEELKAAAPPVEPATSPQPAACGQCGQPYDEQACGPTHAMIAAERQAGAGNGEET